MKINVFRKLIQVACPIFLLICSTNVYCAIVGYWKLDENEGKEVFDSSGNGYYGVLHGGAKRKKVDENYLLKFRGRLMKDYIEIKDAPDLYLKDRLTIELWVFLKDIIPQQTFISKGKDWPAVGYSFLQRRGKIGFCVATRNHPGEGERGGPYEVYSEKILEPSKWHHLAVTYSVKDKKCLIYCNGKVAKEEKDDGEIIYHYSIFQDKTPRPLTIGTMPYLEVSYYVNGILREIKMYNHVLSEDEIRKSYEQNIKIKDMIP